MSAIPVPVRGVRDDAAVIGLVGLAHGLSHYCQLLLAPLFPWLKDAFGVSYAQLGLLLTLFFVVSCGVQTLSGFLVDRHGPRPILFAGLALLAAAAFGFAASTGWWMLAAFSVVAGVGNGVFHPVDYTLLNRKVHPARLGHAFSVHGITGSLGWALAPAMLVPITMAFSWRVALAAAGALVLAVIAVLWLSRGQFALERAPIAHAAGAGAATREDRFAFLAIPAVWMCFAFFLFFAVVLSGVQSFAPEAARQLHGVPALAVPVLFGVMGLGAGVASPSRDLLVKRSSPDNATGRVYGVVYSGLDIGQAVAPLLFGTLMDLQRPALVWLGIALVQGVLILSAFNVRKVRRTALAAA